MATVGATPPVVDNDSDGDVVDGDICELFAVEFGEKAELGWLSAGEDSWCCKLWWIDVSTARGVASEIGDVAAERGRNKKEGEREGGSREWEGIYTCICV